MIGIISNILMFLWAEMYIFIIDFIIYNYYQEYIMYSCYYPRLIIIVGFGIP